MFKILKYESFYFWNVKIGIKIRVTGEEIGDCET
jgi:hypothetical protein